MEKFAEFTKRIQQEEQKMAKKVQEDKWCPKFHLHPPTGWLNDPNGLCQKDGVYHVFFQYSPFDAKGGEKFWGHFKSKDLLHWEYTGAPLAPDTPWDKDGVYSGSALLEDDRMYLYYTGNVKQAGDFDYINEGREANTILVTSGDGTEASEKKLLLTNADYPQDLSCHVRDPKVFKEKDTYYMVQGARSKEGEGLALVFTGTDPEHFTFHNKIQSIEHFGYMWECPDIFLLDNQRIFSFSPQGLTAQIHQYQNVYQSGYCVVDGDFLKDDAAGNNLGKFVEWDMGFDFYAPQTFLDEHGRRLLIGWMGMPDCRYENLTVENGWQHILTVPRALTWSKEKHCVLQNPVEELKKLRIKGTPLKSKFEKTADNCFELLLEKLNDGNCRIEIGNELLLSYDSRSRVFSMKFCGKIGAERKYRDTLLNYPLEQLRILTDSSSVEVFINYGEKVMSTRFYKDEAVTLKVNCKEGNGMYYRLQENTITL